MKLTKIASVLLAVLLVASAGAAAMPGNAPADSQAGQADDHSDSAGDGASAANASDQRPDDAGSAGMADNDSDAGAAAADDKRGPPTDMPAQVPDFVTEVHELINQKLDGTLQNLGEALSAATPGDDADTDDEQSADGEESDTEQQDAERDDDVDDEDGDADRSDSDDQQDETSDDSQSDDDDAQA